MPEVADHQPRLDVHRLCREVERGGRGVGSVRLRRGLFCRYRCSLERAQLSINVGEGQPWATYRLEKRGHKWAARCPATVRGGCGGWAQVLFYPYSTAQGAGEHSGVGLCVDCAQLVYHSCLYEPGVPAIRAELRSGAYGAAIEAIHRGEYLAARTAMEAEGFFPDAQRLVTLPNGHQRRWRHERGSK